MTYLKKLNWPLIIVVAIITAWTGLLVFSCKRGNFKSPYYYSINKIKK